MSQKVYSSIIVATVQTESSHEDSGGYTLIVLGF